MQDSKNEEERDLSSEGEKKKSFVEFLFDKGLSRELIKTILRNDFTEEYVRLLKTLGFTEEELKQTQEAWKEYLEKMKSLTGLESTVSVASSSEFYLSPDGLYLKKHLSKALSRALRDLIMKKPYDCVEYLAHWLLHLKVCEERRNKQKEIDIQLMIERQRLKEMMDMQSEETLIKFDGAEFQEDWDFINYEQPV